MVRLCAFRRCQRFICRLLIGVLVFAQLAIAAYACPALAQLHEAATDHPVVAMADTGKAAALPSGTSDAPTEAAAMPPGCDQMDSSAPQLCAEHCRFGQQSADHAPALTVPAAVPTTLYILPVQPEPPGPVRPAADMALEQVAASPPLAVLHCCYRI